MTTTTLSSLLGRVNRLFRASSSPASSLSTPASPREQTHGGWWRDRRRRDRRRRQRPTPNLEINRHETNEQIPSFYVARPGTTTTTTQNAAILPFIAATMLGALMSEESSARAPTTGRTQLVVTSGPGASRGPRGTSTSPPHDANHGDELGLSDFLREFIRTIQEAQAAARRGEQVARESDIEAALASVYKETAGEEDTRQCPVCLEPIARMACMTPPNCNHTYCSECLTKWIEAGKFSCPVCRSEMRGGE